ncbi:MAG: ferrous iron transporter B [Acidobacteria bacterium]|nr:MAG: ferrous iron transporter B [Acidobacteriota bacterium]
MNRVALIGNPNTGKTTLFNRLCGVRAKTSNFPGTTTSMRVGHHTRVDGRGWEVVDLPGVYGLSFDGPESRIVRHVLHGEDGQTKPDALVVIVDATNMSRNLILVGELLRSGTPLVVALNMTDLAARRGLSLNAAVLAARIGAEVVPIVASKGTGVAALSDAVDRLSSTQPAPAITPPPSNPDAMGEWADVVLEAAGGSLKESASDPLTERLDRFLTHPVFGTLVFLAVMGGLFWTLFALANYPMDLIEATFAYLGKLATTYLPNGPIAELLSNGIIGGIAGTIVFLPQICLLFFLISLLEDTGYLARAAFVNDRFFRRFGLPGHAFVPLLTSHACALPGIMSTRLIPSRRDRIVTILVAPFISCSARLPVYVLLTGLLFADRPWLAGPAFASCYLLGAGAAFTSAWLFGRTVFRGTPRSMVLELPTYKRPSIRTALLTAKDQGLAFLQTAGTVIVAICIVMWWLSAYPKTGPVPQAEALRSHGLVQEADAVQAQAQQANSVIGRVGRTVEPVFRPLGYDWQLSVGLMTSFLAREVFVSTMTVLAGGAGDPSQDPGVRQRIRTMTRDDGRLVFTPATCASALVFFVLAMQCLPTLAVTRREAGGVKYALLQLTYMSSVAWISAFVVFQGLRLAGVS